MENIKGFKSFIFTDSSNEKRESDALPLLDGSYALSVPVCVNACYRAIQTIRAIIVAYVDIPDAWRQFFDATRPRVVGGGERKIAAWTVGENDL
jgi:hypothetical protein